MYGAPDLHPTGHQQELNFNDPAAKEVKENLVQVKNSFDKGLSALLHEAGQLLENAQNTSVEERDNLLKKIKAMTEGTEEVTRGITSFGQGQQAELDMMTEAQNGNDKLDAWVASAAAHFSQAQKQTLRGVEIVGEAGALAHVVDQWHEGKNAAEKQNSFMQKIGQIAVGIEVIIARVNSFPDRLAEAIVSGVDNRKQAVNVAVKNWAAEASGFYQKMMQGAGEVMTNTSDTTGALLDVAGHQIESGVSAFGRGVQRGIFNPLISFITETVIPGIKNAADATRETLFEQVKAISSDYSQSLAKRREGRAKEIEAPSSPAP